MGGIVDAIFGNDDAADAQAQAAQAGANASLEATRLSLAQQQKMFDATQAQQKPLYDMGLSAITQAYGGRDANGNYYFDPNKLNQYAPNEAFKYQDYQAQQFDPSKIDLKADPSYQFRLNEGINALDKSASAKGMLLSGAQQKAVQNYGQDLASQQYQQAYANALTTNQNNNNIGLQEYQTNQGNALTGYNSNVNLGLQKYNQLASVLGAGQVAGNNLQQNNTQLANSATATNMQNANNLASSYAYGANAQANAQAQNTNALLGIGSLALGGYKLFK